MWHTIVHSNKCKNKKYQGPTLTNWATAFFEGFLTAVYDENIDALIKCELSDKDSNAKTIKILSFLIFACWSIFPYISLFIKVKTIDTKWP